MRRFSLTLLALSLIASDVHACGLLSRFRTRSTASCGATATRVYASPQRVQAAAQAPLKSTPQASAPVSHNILDRINALRARYGRGPLVHDESLAQWAANNNIQCSARGMGHHINPNCYQNVAMASDPVAAWEQSPAHLANLLAPVTRVGFASDGRFATLNLR